MIADLSLCLVTDARLAARSGHDLTQLVRAAVDGGVTTVQVREKGSSARRFLETVAALSEAIPAEVALIVNDRVDVFLAARAEGVRVTGMHIGQSDLPAGAVRALIGPDAILGVSACSLGQLSSAAASAGRVDYVGIGALRPTATKPDAPAPLGHDGFARLVAASALPAVAIGGVTRADVARVRAAGAAGVAVVSAICSSPDPTASARELRTAWERQ